MRHADQAGWKARHLIQFLQGGAEVARQPHKLEVVRSSRTPATNSTFSVRRGAHKTLISLGDGECERMVTCVSRRAGTAFLKRFAHDLEVYDGVAGEKPRHVCIAQALIARRAGKPTRNSCGSFFEPTIRRRADAQEGRG